MHGAVLRSELARIEGMGDDILFHDDLDEVAVPFLLHQVVSDAERHGLQYLCDSSLWRRSLDRVAENMRGLLSQFNAKAYMARDQYHDFIDGHGFRRTLLCHDDISLDRDPEPSCIKRFYLASSATPSETDIDPATTGNVESKTKMGDMMTIKHPLTKAALLHLSQCWPMAVSFENLLDAARARLMARAEMGDFCSAEQVETMTRALFNAMCGGDIEFYLFPLPCVAEVSELPEVSRLVQHWPMAMSFEEVLNGARARLMSSAENQSASSDEQIDAMTRALFTAVYGGHVEIYLFPLPCAFAVSERPEVSRLIRKQASMARW